MVARRPVELKRIQVLGRGVALVAGPAVRGVTGPQALHQQIADGLGDHRRGRDRVAFGVAIDDRLVWAFELGTGQPVHEDIGGNDAEAAQRAAHRQDRRAPDIEAVDFVHARGPHGHGYGTLADAHGQLGALQRGEQLRVVEPPNRLRADRKHDGRGHHWSSQGAAARFVHTSDDAPPFAPQRDFALERGAAVPHSFGCSCSAAVAVWVAPFFSRMRAALPASRRRKYSFARRTRPLRTSSISAIAGACNGKMRSTPTPAEIFRTVKVALMPAPRRAMHTPSNACRRSLSPSRTRTITRTVSPGSNAGRSVRSPSRSTALNRFMTCAL